MYLDESELLVNVSLLLLSSPSLLFLFGTNLSLAFPFLNPPWNAALAYIDMSIKEASQHKQTQIPDQNLHMNMILVKSFFFQFLTSPSFDFFWQFHVHVEILTVKNRKGQESVKNEKQKHDLSKSLRKDPATKSSRQVGADNPIYMRK